MNRRVAFLTRLVFLLIFILGGAYCTWAESYYTVKRGESLYTIAKKFNTSIGELQEINQLAGSKIKAGQRLLIPSSPSLKQAFVGKKEKGKTVAPEDDLWQWDIPEKHIVKKGETLKQIARRYQLTVEDLKEINQLAGERLKAGQIIYLQKVYRDEEESREQKGKGFFQEQEEKRKLKQVKGLGFLITEKDRILLIRVAKSFLGLRYTRGGTSINGMDCSAFVQKIFRIFGVELPRTTQEQFQIGYLVARHNLCPGDLVFFTRGPSGYPGHVGIYIGNNQFIHTSLRRGRVEIDSLENGYFASRYLGARRIEEAPEKLEDGPIIHVHVSNSWE